MKATTGVVFPPSPLDRVDTDGGASATAAPWIFPGGTELLPSALGDLFLSSFRFSPIPTADEESPDGFPT